jgi:hypothetical protein
MFIRILEHNATIAIVPKMEFASEGSFAGARPRHPAGRARRPAQTHPAMRVGLYAIHSAACPSNTVVRHGCWTTPTASPVARPRPLAGVAAPPSWSSRRPSGGSGGDCRPRRGCRGQRHPAKPPRSRAEATKSATARRPPPPGGGAGGAAALQNTHLAWQGPNERRSRSAAEQPTGGGPGATLAPGHFVQAAPFQAVAYYLQSQGGNAYLSAVMVRKYNWS